MRKDVSPFRIDQGIHSVAREEINKINFDYSGMEEDNRKGMEEVKGKGLEEEK